MTINTGDFITGGLPTMAVQGQVVNPGVIEFMQVVLVLIKWSILVWYKD